MITINYVPTDEQITNVISYGFMGRYKLRQICHLVQYIIALFSFKYLISRSHYYRYPPHSTKHIPSVLRPIAQWLITPSLSLFIHSPRLYRCVHQLLHSRRPEFALSSMLAQSFKSSSSILGLTLSLFVGLIVIRRPHCYSSVSLLFSVVVLYIHTIQGGRPSRGCTVINRARSHKQRRLYLIDFRSSP
jgi:hypothetical protein